MNQKIFCLISGIIFLVVVVVHLGMFVLGEGVIVAGRSIPVWQNLVIVLVAGYFAYQGLRLSTRS